MLKLTKMLGCFCNQIVGLIVHGSEYWVVWGTVNTLFGCLCWVKFLFNNRIQKKVKEMY